MKIALTLSLFVSLFFGDFIDFYSDNNTTVLEKTIDIPRKNKQIVALVKQYGPKISSTYEKAVCTELVIQILQKIQPLNATDKKRIRIITNEDIHELLRQNSPIPKGVYYSLIEKGVGIPIAEKANVLEGDFVQFWTTTWGHCGIVKSIDLQNNEMELYSSFPSTNGYGVQRFSIPKDVFFVRLK
jgi:hypothetical protein